MKSLTALLLLAALFFLNSCEKKKKECSDDVKNTYITSNGPVIEGWSLELSTENVSDQAVYQWKGPNGWWKTTKYDFNNPTPWKLIRDSLTMNDAGNYYVEVIDQGCIVQRGVTSVQVIDAPLPPCTVANNSSTTNLGGVGGTTYSIVSHTGGIYYNVYATNASGSQTINFVFKDGEPKPGMYLVDQGYHPSEKNHASVYIQSGFYDFFLESYYTVYVNKVNGKLQFSFCNGKFTNPISSNPIIISAKVTLP